MSTTPVPGTARAHRTVLGSIALLIALLASMLAFTVASPAGATQNPPEEEACYEKYTEHQYKKQTRIVWKGKITGNITYDDWEWYTPTSTKWSETNVEVLEGPAYHSDVSDTVLYERWREYRYKNTGETRVKEREVPCPEPEDFDVIPSKSWDFDGAEVPEDGSATIEITSSEGSKSWTFNSSGGFIGDSTPLTLPAGTEYTVSEPVIVNPVGWNCARQVSEDPYAEPIVPVEGPVVEKVYNECDEVPEPDRKVEERSTVDCVANVVIHETKTTTYEWDGDSWVPVVGEWEFSHTTAYDGPPCDNTTTTASTTTTETTVPETTTTTDDGEVAGIGEEADPGDVAAEGEELPRTGAGAGALALVAALTLGLGLTLRTASRRLS